eukprot:jgi/Botrbrau1/11518/Bobra.0198s0015.1
MALFVVNAGNLSKVSSFKKSYAQVSRGNRLPCIRISCRAASRREGLKGPTAAEVCFFAGLAAAQIILPIMAQMGAVHSFQSSYALDPTSTLGVLTLANPASLQDWDVQTAPDPVQGH